MRPPRPDETEAIVDFVYRAFSEAIGEPDVTAAIWARDLLRGDHPTADPADGTVVVDVVTHRVVGCCFLIRQTWTYAGIPFQVGRPELIATAPDHRGQGLVRAQLAEAHAHGELHGDEVQAITGIPWFYRQFGYEPALIGDTIARLPLERMTPAPTGPFRVRPATVADATFIARLYERALARTLVGAVRDAAIWRYELGGRTSASDYWHEHRILEDATGTPAGYLAWCAEPRDGELVCTLCELAEGVAWADAAPAIVETLRAAAAGFGVERIAFDWTPDQPLVAAGGFTVEATDPFAWYLRVPDLPAFLHRIAPALEARLAASALAAHTGELRIATYPGGLRLAFERGRLAAVEPLASLSHRQADAALPGRTLLQLLFGARSLDELAHAFPSEARARTPEARLLLETLFPRRPSAVWPIA